MAPDIKAIIRTAFPKTINTTVVLDQYADGKAARSWNNYVGGQQKRTLVYRDHFVALLKQHNVRSILDVACGTG